MTKDQVLGMIVGCAIGDAYGAPLEFMHPDDIVLHDSFIAGGAHNVTVGEWTDDTAMMLAAASAYCDHNGFHPTAIVDNFKAWRKTGKFGTRNYVFDIGGTCSEAIDKMTPVRPYAGKASNNASGNGSIMRIAPAIAANHNNMSQAIGEAVALSLMTHGNADTIIYVSAFVTEMFRGKQHCNEHLRERDLRQSFGSGSIMQAYAVAWHSAHYGHGFDGAIQKAASFGYDTDTNCAVTGMLVGGICGYSAIPKEWLHDLQQHDYICAIAEKLYEIGNK